MTRSTAPAAPSSRCSPTAPTASRSGARSRPAPAARRPTATSPSWLRWLAAGRVDDQDEPTFLGIMSVIDTAKGDSWVAGPPIVVQRALAKVLAPVANRRGCRASVD